MPQRQVTRARGFLSRGALLSLLLHVNLFGPIGLAAWIYGGQEEAQRNAEVDVAFEDVNAADLPKDLPPIEPLAEPLAAPEKPEKPKPEPRKKLDIAKQEQPKKDTKKDADKPKPEPEVVVPPLPPMPAEPPPPPEPRKGHEKMVDLDNGNDKPPPDAKYLAEKNNRAAVETRATDTNLEKAQKGKGAASAPSEREEPNPGGDKQKIAELEDQKSALGRKAPDVTPHVNPVVAEPKPEVEAQKKSLLALRDPAPRVHELTPETADLSLPRAADGELEMPERAVRGKKSDPSKVAPGKKVKLAINGEDYEYMFGADAEAERRLAQKQRSMKVGKHLQKLAHMGSALENFIPEVQPGNQTALNTRAAPFAAYIARMHRSIHRLWGFGALEDWDELSGSSPLNNRNLLTTLELVLNGDGTVDKVTIVKGSGYLGYDAAAMDVAYSAGPYPDPPRAIRSKNGKIYVHWRFYRDERQCATSGVDYFILDNAPKGTDRPDGPTVGEAPAPAASPAPAGFGSAASQPAGRTWGAPGAPAPATPALASPPLVAPPLVAPPSAAPTVPLMGAPPSGTTSGSGGLRRLQRSSATGHRAGMQRLEEEVAAAEEQDAGKHPATPETPGPTARASDPGARAIAERWFAALAAGDANTLANLAALPFKTSGKEVAKRAQLAAMLADLVQETTGGRAGRAVQIFTAAGLRAALGKLPPNLEDGSSNQLYAVVSSDAHDALILVLAEHGGIWRPVGLVRR